MKTMKVQLASGHMVEIENIGLSYCDCFSQLSTDRIIGLGLNADGHSAVCIWKEVGGLWKHHVTITLRNSGHDDCLMAITAATRIHIKMGQPPVSKDMELIIIG